MQQQNVGMVIRTIANEIPDFAKLGLPESLKDIVMTKRGLVLVVGATGSGKSTSLAAMIDHRNRSSAGHIVTVEDPVEFVHQSQQSLITHREVGIDTHSWHNALKNTCARPRRHPDRRNSRHRDHGARDRVRRDRSPVPGHAALQQRQPDHRPHHQFLSRGAPQAAAHGSVEQPARDHLAAPGANRDGKGRKAAIEILINTPIVADKLLKGEFHEIKAIMGKSRELGMKTFDWSLFELYNDGVISYDEAIRNADSANELRLNIKLNGTRASRSARCFRFPCCCGRSAASTGWSTTGVSAAMTLGFLAMAVGSAGWGALSDRIGARWTCLIGSLLLGVGLELASMAPSLTGFQLGVRLVGGPGHLGDLRADHGLRHRLVLDAAQPGGIAGISGIRRRAPDDVAVGRPAGA
jgi:energy-coupling factor transporter ATP-binding protein EcfA2